MRGRCDRVKFDFAYKIRGKACSSDGGGYIFRCYIYIYVKAENICLLPTLPRFEFPTYFIFQFNFLCPSYPIYGFHRFLTFTLFNFCTCALVIDLIIRCRARFQLWLGMSWVRTGPASTPLWDKFALKSCFFVSFVIGFFYLSECLLVSSLFFDSFPKQRKNFNFTLLRWSYLKTLQKIILPYNRRF